MSWKFWICPNVLYNQQWEASRQGKSVPTSGCFARLPRVRAVFLAIAAIAIANEICAYMYHPWQFRSDRVCIIERIRDVGVIVWHALLCKWVCKHMSIMTVKNKTTSPNETVFHTSGLLWGYFTGNWCVDSRHRWRLFFVFLFRSQSNGWTNYQVSDYLKPQVDHVASQKWYGIVRFLSLIMWIYDIFSKKAWWAIRHSFAYHCIYLCNMQNMCHAKSFWYPMPSLDLWNWGWLSSISDGHDNTILCQHACGSAMECGSGKFKT